METQIQPMAPGPEAAGETEQTDKPMFYCETHQREFGTARGLMLHNMRSHDPNNPWKDSGAKSARTRARIRGAKLGWKRRKREERERIQMQKIERREARIGKTHTEPTRQVAVRVSFCPGCGFDLRALKGH